ncbi:M15 family metallopeptidase [Flavobacterium branchiophilum]|nr:M15 family metallopeptidase [Flavobacterium branchiophilum]
MFKKIKSFLLISLIMLPFLVLSQIKKSNSKTKSAEKLLKIPKNDSTFVNIWDFSKDFVLEMKYATHDNFLKQQVYDCEVCLLRYKTVVALLQAQRYFMERGYKIKLFDCYRPLDIQKKMWKIVPNSNYVANPARGSVHNRGAAVDLTLVDFCGNELEMGTAFDFFGPEAAHDYQLLTEEALCNRKILKKGMELHGFKIFESEWWHYNLETGFSEKISNFKWNCN